MTDHDATAPLACESVGKRYGRLTALRAVSFSLERGESLALFGRNGAGKSTLLGIAATLVRTYDGTVQIFGTEARRAGADVRRAIGFVSHETFLYNDLTVSENLRFYGQLYGLADPARRAGELLERFDLEAKARSPVRTLSRGMKQRLSLARALVHDPRLLLLDEPFTGLDEASCEALSGMLHAFVAGGGAVLLTTHDLDRGLAASSRVAILDRGVIALGEATADVDAAAFRRRYRDVLAH